MHDFIIMTDATCELNEAILKEYDITVVPSHIILPGGKDIPSFHEWKEFKREEFYSELKKNPNGYSTSPPNVEEFAAAFEQAVSQGKDVLLMTISSGISGTYNFALQAKKLVEEKYPDAKICCVDTLRFGPGFGLIAVHASLLKKEGKSFDEIVEYVENNKNRFHQAGWLDDLSFVASKGRMTHARAFLGTLVGVKPIGEFDYNGLTTMIGKAKGTKSAYAALIHYIGQTIENPEDQIIFIAQTNRYPQAEIFKQMIEENFHPKAVIINDVFPMSGISIGPGLMAAYYMGKPISEGLTEERAILERFTSEGK